MFRLIKVNDIGEELLCIRVILIRKIWVNLCSSLFFAFLGGSSLASLLGSLGGSLCCLFLLLSLLFLLFFLKALLLLLINLFLFFTLFRFWLHHLSELLHAL